ncbi:MAG: hypothetical protein AAF081_04525 [Actinomycetota bacterium]
MLPILWEIIIPLLLAVVLGVFIGWLIWRWRRRVISETEWIIAQERIRTLEGELAENQAERERLDAARAAAAVERDDARKAIRGVEADLEATRADMAAVAEAKAAADARVGELDAELGGAKIEAADLTSKLSALSSDLDGARAQIDTANADAVAARADAETAKVAAFADLDAAKGDAAAAREATASLQAELDLARAEASSAQAAADAARLDAERAQADLAECRSEVEALSAADDPETNWQVGVTSLGTPGAAHKDDLKVINGVGPKMEMLLNGFGIQTWEQLAWLTDGQVQTVDDALQEFPGRIERDEWVPQAKDLIVRFPDRADRPTRETFLNRSEDS